MGESLSPKKAPETTAPAIMGAGMDMLMPMPIRARPTVPALPQEVPVAREVTQQIKKAAGRKILGDRIFSP